MVQQPCHATGIDTQSTIRPAIRGPWLFKLTRVVSCAAPGSGIEAPRPRPCRLTLQAKEVGGQAGDAVEQGANTAADRAEEAGSAAEDYSKTGQKQVTAYTDDMFEATVFINPTVFAMCVGAAACCNCQ